MHKVSENPLMSRRFDFRNPPRATRILLLAGVLSIPGALAGVMLSLFCGAPVTCGVVGGLLGAILGGLMEAWPLSNSKGR